MTITGNQTGGHTDAWTPVLVSSGIPSASLAAISRQLGRPVVLREASHLTDILGLLSANDVSVVLLHVRQSEIAADVFLSNLGAYFNFVRTQIILLSCDPADLGATDSRLFFVSTSDLPTAQIASLVTAAIEEGERSAPLLPEPPSKVQLEEHQSLLLELQESLDRAVDLDGLVAAVLSILRMVVLAECQNVFLVNSDSGRLWRYPKPVGAEELTGPLPMGLVGFCLRAIQMEEICQADQDLRYLERIDNSTNIEAPTMLIAPIPRADGSVFGVVQLLRSGASNRFGDLEKERLRRILGFLSFHFERLLPRLLVKEEASEVSGTAEVGVFRDAAIRRAEEPPETLGRNLAGASNWLDRVYFLLLASLAPAILVLLFAEVHEHATGAALVALEGRVDITAQSSGLVEKVFVEPGQAVKEGDILLENQISGQAPDIDFLNLEHRKRLRALLLDPTDTAARIATLEMRERLNDAAREIEASRMRTPRSGTVSDVRVVPGQFFNHGKLLLSIKVGSETPRVIAALPGRYRPLVNLETFMLLRLDGFPEFSQRLRITRLDNELISANEATNIFDEALALVSEGGPVFLIFANLPDRFQVGDVRYRFYRGMKGSVELRLRSRPLLADLFPWFDFDLSDLG